MTIPQTNDLTWTRGSTAPLVMTLGFFDDARIRVYNEGSSQLAFAAVLADDTFDITDEASGTVTFKPTADQTIKLTPNVGGEAKNYFLVETKSGGVWTRRIEGLIYADGGALAVQMPVIGASDIVIFKPGKPIASEIIFYMQVVRAFTFASGLTGSLFKALTAATSTAALTIKRNGSSIGTLSFAAAGTVPTVTFADAVTFAVNDIIQIEAPGTPDATLANISLCFKGSR